MSNEQIRMVLLPPAEVMKRRFQDILPQRSWAVSEFFESLLQRAAGKRMTAEEVVRLLKDTYEEYRSDMVHLAVQVALRNTFPLYIYALIADEELREQAKTLLK